MKVVVILVFLHISVQQAPRQLQLFDPLAIIRQQQEEMAKLPLIEVGETHDQNADDQTVTEVPQIMDQEFDLESFLSDLALQYEAEETLQFMPELFGYLDVENSEDVEVPAGEPVFGEVVNIGTQENPDDDQQYYHHEQAAPEVVTKWPETMINFNPDDMMSFELAEGQVETLYQEVEAATTIRGAFFIPYYPKTNRLDFSIKKLDNTQLYSNEGVQDGIFSLELKKGEYKFVFYNRKSEGNAYTVNFALDVHESASEHLMQQDVDPLTLRVENLMNAMGDNYFETKFISGRSEDGYLYLLQTHNKLLLFTVLETLGVVIVNIWQVIYLKRILENKRLI